MSVAETIRLFSHSVLQIESASLKCSTYSKYYKYPDESTV